MKNCEPYTSYISQINKIQVDNLCDVDMVMPIYYLIEYRKNYTKISGSLWQYNNDVPSNKVTNSVSFTFKAKITGSTPADGNTKDVEIVIPLTL